MLNAREIMELQNLAGIGEKIKKLIEGKQQWLEKIKLMELLSTVTFGVNKQTLESYLPPSAIAEIVDHFIANGVAVPVRCKACNWYRKHEGGVCMNPKCTKSWYGCPVPAEHFCSYGERRE